MRGVFDESRAHQFVESRAHQRRARYALQSPPGYGLTLTHLKQAGCNRYGSYLSGDLGPNSTGVLWSECVPHIFGSDGSVRKYRKFTVRMTSDPGYGADPPDQAFCDETVGEVTLWDGTSSGSYTVISGNGSHWDLGAYLMKSRTQSWDYVNDGGAQSTTVSSWGTESATVVTVTKIERWEWGELLSGTTERAIGIYYDNDCPVLHDKNNAPGPGAGHSYTRNDAEAIVEGTIYAPLFNVGWNEATGWAAWYYGDIDYLDGPDTVWLRGGRYAVNALQWYIRIYHYSAIGAITAVEVFNQGRAVNYVFFLEPSDTTSAGAHLGAPDLAVPLDTDQTPIDDDIRDL